MKPPYKEYKIYPCDYGRVYVEAEYGKEGAPDFERTCQICLVVYDKKDLVISHDSSGVHVCRNCAAQQQHATGKDPLCAHIVGEHIGIDLFKCTVCGETVRR